MHEPMFTWDQLTEITAGTWACGIPDGQSRAGVTAVLDDSRQIVEGALFVAIRGELADGHAYVRAAVEQGAAAVCVDKTPSEEALAVLRARAVPCLRVVDSLAAFQALAAAHRNRLHSLLVVGITGSCGKTSTKEMIAAALEQGFPGRVLKTEGNTNNHFGVPRNLLRLTEAHRAAVLELGSNHPGEIASLTAMVKPDIGVVSNIGPAHLEFFGDLAGVAREKGDLLAGTAANGTAVYTADTPHVDILRAKAGARRSVTFGLHPGCDIRVTYRGLTDKGYEVQLDWQRSGETVRFCWGCGGEHQALNAAAAAAVGTAAGMKTDEIVQGLRQCRLPAMRMERHDIGGTVWVNDAFNANPASMRAALCWFGEAAAAAAALRTVLVLGDMLELGMHAAPEHAQLLSWVRQLLPEAEVFTVGPLMAHAAEACGLRNAPSAGEAAPAVRDLAVKGAWVLLKGSRGIKLETIMPR